MAFMLHDSSETALINYQCCASQANEGLEIRWVSGSPCAATHSIHEGWALWATWGFGFSRALWLLRIWAVAEDLKAFMLHGSSDMALINIKCCASQPNEGPGIPRISGSPCAGTHDIHGGFVRSCSSCSCSFQYNPCSSHDI